MAPPLSVEVVRVLEDLNPWWGSPAVVRPRPPAWRRFAIRDLSRRLGDSRGLIEVVRGPRQ